MENMKIWNATEKTNPDHTKKVNQRGGFTAICATSQIKVMTEQFGACGTGWGLEQVKYEIIQLSDKRTDDILIFSADLYYFLDDKKGIIPIDSEIDIWTGSRKNNDIYKKVKTDAMTKGFSFLGLSADVFMGMYDDNKYVTTLKEEFSEPKQKTIPVSPQLVVTEITHNIVKSYIKSGIMPEGKSKDLAKELNDKKLLANQQLVDELIKEYGSLNA